MRSQCLIGLSKIFWRIFIPQNSALILNLSLLWMSLVNWSTIQNRFFWGKFKTALGNLQPKLISFCCKLVFVLIFNFLLSFSIFLLFYFILFLRKWKKQSLWSYMCTNRQPKLLGTFMASYSTAIHAQIKQIFDPKIFIKYLVGWISRK